MLNDCIIYWTFAPSDQHLQAGSRPAYVLLDNGTHLLLAPLTTRRKRPMPTHAPINTTGTPSTVLTEQLFWVRRPRAFSTVLPVDSETARRVHRCLDISLGLIPSRNPPARRPSLHRGQIYAQGSETLVVLQNDVGNTHSPTTIVGTLDQSGLTSIRTVSAHQLLSGKKLCEEAYVPSGLLSSFLAA